MSVPWPYVVVFLVTLLGVLFYLSYPRVENSFVFYPASSFELTPSDLGLPYEDIFFTTADGERLHGWLFPLPCDSPIILFCHGNAGNISYRLDNIRMLLESGLSVFIFDYRGYGKSTGTPSERGLYRDGEAAWDYLVQEQQVRPERIVLFGRSLGAAVAVDLALKRKVRSLIAEGAFTSTREMAKTLFPLNLLSLFIPAHYNNREKVARLPLPKLIVHGDADEIVPFAMGKKLFAAAMIPKWFYRIPGAGHNDTYLVGGRTYFEALAAFARDSKLQEGNGRYGP